MRDSDLPLLRIIVNDGAASWVKKVPKVALKRLIAEGLIEVETRTVSAWAFGPARPGWNATADERAEYAATMARLPEPIRKTRVEVWAFPTSLGITEYNSTVRNQQHT